MYLFKDYILGLILSCKDEFKELHNLRTFYERINSYAVVTRRILNNSTLCYFNDELSWFDGNCYTRIPPDQLRDMLYNALCEVGTASVEAFRVHNLAIQTICDKHIYEDRNLVVFTNGVLNVSTGVFSDFSEHHYVCYRVPYNYDPSSNCPMWEKFLKEVLPDAAERRRLQEFVGMIYIDRSKISIEKALLLIGDGSNGKSVVYNVISAMVGKNYVSALTPAQLMSDRHLPELNNKRVNYCSEVNSTDAFTSALKALISGETVSGWSLFKGVTSVVSPPFVFTMNTVPPIDDRSYGFFRRLLPIQFNITIPPWKQDKSLAKRIIDSELSGIFNWAMEGRERLMKQKGEFTLSPTGEKLVEKIRRISAPVASYMEDNGLASFPQYKGQQPVKLQASSILKELDGISKKELSLLLQKYGFKRIKSGNMYYIAYPVTSDHAS